MEQDIIPESRLHNKNIKHIALACGNWNDSQESDGDS